MLQAIKIINQLKLLIMKQTVITLIIIIITAISSMAQNIEGIYYSNNDSKYMLTIKKIKNDQCEIIGAGGWNGLGFFDGKTYR